MSRLVLKERLKGSDNGANELIQQIEVRFSYIWFVIGDLTYVLICSEKRKFYNAALHLSGSAIYYTALGSPRAQNRRMFFL